VKELRLLVPKYTKEKDKITTIRWSKLAAELKRSEKDCKERWEVLSKGIRR
jgi:hypothetical protein